MFGGAANTRCLPGGKGPWGGIRAAGRKREKRARRAGIAGLLKKIKVGGVTVRI